MNNQKKIYIKSFSYKNHILLAFSKDEFLQLFDTDKIEFEGTIINDKIVLTSPIIKTIGSPVKQPPDEMEIVTNV